MGRARAAPCLHGVLRDAEGVAVLQEARLLGERGPVLLQPIGLRAPVVLHAEQRKQAAHDRQRHGDQRHSSLQSAPWYHLLFPSNAVCLNELTGWPAEQPAREELLPVLMQSICHGKAGRLQKGLEQTADSRQCHTDQACAALHTAAMPAFMLPQYRIFRQQPCCAWWCTDS